MPSIGVMPLNLPVFSVRHSQTEDGANVHVHSNDHQEQSFSRPYHRLPERRTLLLSTLLLLPHLISLIASYYLDRAPRRIHPRIPHPTRNRRQRYFCRRRPRGRIPRRYLLLDERQREPGSGDAFEEEVHVACGGRAVVQEGLLQFDRGVYWVRKDVVVDGFAWSVTF